MKRWKTVLAGAALALGGMTGCKQPLYMSKTDHEEMLALNIPPNLDSDPNLSLIAPTGEGRKAPATVLDPDRPPRYLTLPEAVSIALEQGTEGAQGRVVEQLGAQGAGAVGVFGTFRGDDNVRVFALTPATEGARIESALSKFDARWVNSLSWQKQDNAVANTLANFNNGDIAQFQSGIYKPLPTGGLAGITTQVDYTRLSNAPAGFQVVNPAYRPQILFQFEQPLLQNFGVEMNQLLPAHPGSLQTPGLTGLGSNAAQAGILISRIVFDQTRAEFEQRLNNMLLNVERAYWDLYAAYFALYAAEQGMRQSYVTFQLTQTLEIAGQRARQEVAQVRAQFEEFRARRLVALGQVLEAERNLRGLLSLPIEDGTRLVPADAPTVAPFVPDWPSSVTEALANRPELINARHTLKQTQLNVILAKNFTRPDLRFLASYNINGIGTQLDGSEPNNAIGNLANNQFNSWTLGFRYNLPIGFRDAHAGLRIARLNLAQAYVSLKSFELKAERILQQAYQQLFQAHEVIKAQRNRREALAQQLSGLAERVRLGKDPVLVLLDAQRNYADALAQEHRAIADYNNAIAIFEHSKGAILTYNNVSIAEGPLPPLSLQRAVDHFEQRTRGLVARERAMVPSADIPPPLPALFENAQKVPELPDDKQNLPAPMPLDPMSRVIPKAAEPAVLSPPAPVAPAPPLSTVPAIPTSSAPVSPFNPVRAPASPATRMEVPSAQMNPGSQPMLPGQPVSLPPTGIPLRRPQ